VGISNITYKNPKHGISKDAAESGSFLYTYLEDLNNDQKELDAFQKILVDATKIGNAAPRNEIIAKAVAKRVVINSRKKVPHDPPGTVSYHGAKYIDDEGNVTTLEETLSSGSQTPESHALTFLSTDTTKNAQIAAVNEELLKLKVKKKRRIQLYIYL
jgi:hypothetical protein